MKRKSEELNRMPILIPPKTRAKYEKLKKRLSSLGGAVVAFSGGVDSSFLLAVAHDVLGEKVLAVIACSETYPNAESRKARQLAKKIGARVRVIQTRELDNPSFRENSPFRCYFCKKELFTSLKKIAAEENIPWVLDGANWDDRQDFRPGSQAAHELGVLSPLQEVKLTKEEIRLLSRWLGLPTWDKPSLACLASRIPYYIEIDQKTLEKIAQAEAMLQRAGFKQVRVRHHGEKIARLEVLPEDFSRLISSPRREKLVRQLKSLGYVYITLDLEGYRSGSLNQLL